MALPLRTLDQTEPRHDRAHRTSVGARRTGHRPHGPRAHAPKKGHPAEPTADSAPTPAPAVHHSAAIWREMMSRWMSDVPS